MNINKRNYSSIVPGSVFGRVTILGPYEYDYNIDEILWKYKCELCGYEGWASTEALMRNPQGNNDIKIVCHRCRHIPDLRNKVFGKLTVLRLSSINTVGIWECQCSCEAHNIIYVQTSSLTSGNTKSCGCLQKENHFKKHNMSDSKIYGIHKSIGQRCYNKNNKLYKNYGAKGCTVCRRWQGKDGFDRFYEDMGETYIEGYKLALKDFSKGYTPENCIWVSNSDITNYINNSKFKSLTFNGIEYKPAINLCKDLKKKYNINDARSVSATYISSRINRGWGEKEAVIIPPLAGKESKEDWYKRHNINSETDLPDVPIRIPIHFDKSLINSNYIIEE